MPALDILRQGFPEAQISVMSGPRPKEIFINNSGIGRHIVFDKHAPLKDKVKLFNNLRKEKFDMVIDFRNSLFGALLPARYKTNPFLSIPKAIRHMKESNLHRLQEVIKGCKDLQTNARRISLWIDKQDKEYAEVILRDNGITENDLLIVVAAGARSHIKRWGEDKSAQLCERLLEDKDIKIILVGDEESAGYINNRCGDKVLNFCGKTKISQLAALLKKARLLITNDSATMHIGSYLDVPTLAVFGPTNELRYGPWGKVSSVVKKDIFCRPCEKAQCRFGHLDCMRLIKAEDVLKEAKNMLSNAAFRDKKN
jgi:ADP-heptose:LPS heptosyltransferase